MFSLMRLAPPFIFGALTSNAVTKKKEGINFVFWGIALIVGLLGLRLAAQTLTAVKKAF